MAFLFGDHQTGLFVDGHMLFKCIHTIQHTPTMFIHILLTIRSDIYSKIIIIKQLSTQSGQNKNLLST